MALGAFLFEEKGGAKVRAEDSRVHVRIHVVLISSETSATRRKIVSFAQTNSTCDRGAYTRAHTHICIRETVLVFSEVGGNLSLSLADSVSL